MKFKFYGRFMDVTDSLREYTEKKLSKLDWFFGDEAEAQVKYTLERGGKNIVEMGMIEDDMRIDGNKVSFSIIFDKPTDPFIKSFQHHLALNRLFQYCR